MDFGDPYVGSSCTVWAVALSSSARSKAYFSVDKSGEPASRLHSAVSMFKYTKFRSNIFILLKYKNTNFMSQDLIARRKEVLPSLGSLLVPYGGTAHNDCNSASKGGSLLQSTYPNKVISVITPKSTSTRTEYTFYIEHALYSTYTFYQSVVKL